MTDQVLLKSAKELDKTFQWLEKSNFEPQFMPIIDNDEQALDFVLDTARYYRYPAVELVFKDDSHRMISSEVIDRFHAMGIKVWINSLTLNFPLCGYHDDICSLFDDPNKGWGWLCDHGADVIQTDFVRELNEYLDQRY
jgi:glycerophosphoryl diester phosphodiesterase